MKVCGVYGLESFKGQLYTNEMKTGKKFADKNVIVVGAKNSGIKIA